MEKGVGFIVIFCFVGGGGEDISDKSSTSEPWPQPGIAFINLVLRWQIKAFLRKECKMLPDSFIRSACREKFGHPT